MKNDTQTTMTIEQPEVLETTENKVPSTLNKDELKNIVPAAFVSKPSPKMSPKYQFINTEEVIDKLIEDGFKPFSADQLKYRDKKNPNNGYQFHEISFYHPNLVIFNEVTNEIEEIFEVIITNSHNGYSKFSLYCSFYRLIGENDMLCVSDDLGGIITNNARNISDLNPNTLFNEITNHFLDMVKCIQKMKETKLNKVQQSKMAKRMAEIRHSKQEGKFNYEPQALLIPLRSKDKDKSAWTTYNVIVEKLIKGYGFPEIKNKTKNKLTNSEVVDTNEKMGEEIENNKSNSKIPRKLRAVKHFELALSLNKELFEAVKMC